MPLASVLLSAVEEPVGNGSLDWLEDHRGFACHALPWLSVYEQLPMDSNTFYGIVNDELRVILSYNGPLTLQLCQKSKITSGVLGL